MIQTNQKVDSTGLLQVKLREVNSLDDYSRGSVNHFSNVWNKIAFSIGIRDQLQKGELQIIFEFMDSQFSSLSLADTNQAFILYAAKKLEYDKSHFQSLDNFFIGSVLKSYKEYIRKENMKVKPIPVELQLENKVDLKFEMKRAFEFIKKVYEEEKNFPSIANWSDAFIHAETIGLINMTSKEKKDLVKQTITEIKTKQMQTRLTTGVKGSAVEFEEGNVKVQCRKKALIKYFINK